MSTLICHFDQSNDAICEAASITCASAGSAQALILVSPSNFTERRKIYAKCSNAKVVPLLFDFSDLSATELKQIMGTSGGGANQLYMTVLLSLLRKVIARVE